MEILYQKSSTPEIRYQYNQNEMFMNDLCQDVFFFRYDETLMPFCQRISLYPKAFPHKKVGDEKKTPPMPTSSSSRTVGFPTGPGPGLSGYTPMVPRWSSIATPHRCLTWKTTRFRRLELRKGIASGYSSIKYLYKSYRHPFHGR